ncbi:HesA/MoeB/ThiF family protein [Salipiger aestuarii]|uniref:Molybdopterin/thiamine biosynthesis adenylyltransferase n=1 Tax=Salipiger aestuarii TaxID=568098 RepID=A0A327Y166_9RHOB|nr:HesA/MoeB/ThiF family protein [Salipiger aestuarii]RAK14072.1 molybdopterin/thiamine biosynthesis adenylyltransferase [Salipiger aestuarii]
MTRYARQTCLPEVGPRGQARLAAAHVLVAGAGGLGSALLPLLAGAGVGRIALFDPDRVEAHNLHRQTLYRMADLGQPKAEVAAGHLARLNPECVVAPHVARLGPDADVARADLVIDAADNFATSYALSDLCLASGTPLITASVIARQGYAAGLCGGAPSLRALFPDPPARAATCAEAGVMGPAVALLGALQAQMALSVLLGHSPSPLGQMMTVDLGAWRFGQFRFDDAPEPDAAFPPVVAGARAGDLLIDLRHEALPEDLPSGTRVVLACATGLRAWRAARTLRARGHGDVAICADGR